MSSEGSTNPSRGQPPPHPQGEEEDYGPYPTSTYPHYSSVRSFPPPHPRQHPHPHRDEAGVSEPSEAAMSSPADTEITRLERWAARASVSQFNALSGAIGGFTSGVVTCPLDVIKTKLQAQGGFNPITKGRHVGHPKLYDGLVGTARVIWREEGLRGMYRGLGPIVLGYLPTWAVWFTVYNKSKEYIRPYHGKFLPQGPALLLLDSADLSRQTTYLSSTFGRPSWPAPAAR
jgi:solute carrier family 25 folate transporter 32